MAIIEVSEDVLRRMAGGDVFGQALTWADKVTGLRVDGTVISATVDGVPVRVRILADGIAGQCGCPADGPCAHAVAAALAWVRTGEDEGIADLFGVLRLQDRDWLAARLADLAAADPALAGRLLAEAEDGEALAALEDLRAELDEVLDDLEEDAASQGDYGEWYPDADGLDELLEEAEEFADDAPDAVRELADYAIVRIERLLNYENCYGGGITEALERAQEVHLVACRAGVPDPERLAGRLVTGALESGWGVFRDGLADYADVLGAAGLARCRELLKLAPAKSHGLTELRASLARAEELLGAGTDRGLS